MDDIFVVIPTLNPNIEILSSFLEKLQKITNNILVYDDGSRKEYESFFKEIEKKKIIVLHHYINLGKGRAMKDAFNYLLLKYTNLKGIVTADSDGQHSPKDIEKIAKQINKHPEDLILGVRDFSKENVPKRNMLGNVITRNVFKLFVGLKITDTQTGLRGYPKVVMSKFMTTKGERFEYETNMLIESTQKNVPIYEVPIETIYISGNSESHFNPIKDSFEIYKLFVKFIFSSLSSFIIDIILFWLFSKLIKTNNYIILSTIFARIISSFYNYFVNASLVFKNKNNSSFIKYVLLCIIQMFISGICVNFIFKKLNINLIVIKLIVDIIIFIVNFIIQRKFIFVGEYEKNK